MSKNFLRTGAALVIGLLHIIPLYILINLALKAPTDTSSKWAIPGYLYLDKFVNAWTRADLGWAPVNNVLITAGGVVLVIRIGALAAYPLARYPTRWNNFIYGLCVSCLIVPALTILVPLYKFVVDIGGINTYWAIDLVQVTFLLPLSIFMYTGFIKTISRELDEAARLDGEPVRDFVRIILPLLKPVTASLIIIVGVAMWNDFQFSLFLLQRKGVQTVPLALSQFFSMQENEVAWVAAGCLLSMIPLALVYLALQRYFVGGLAEGAIKG